jgi:hypothetical protein
VRSATSQMSSSLRVFVYHPCRSRTLISEELLRSLDIDIVLGKTPFQTFAKKYNANCDREHVARAALCVSHFGLCALTIFYRYKAGGFNRTRHGVNLDLDRTTLHSMWEKAKLVSYCRQVPALFTTCASCVTFPVLSQCSASLASCLVYM